MTKCRRRRTTGYEDRARLGTTVVSKNCYNGTKNVWTEMGKPSVHGICPKFVAEYAVFIPPYAQKNLLAVDIGFGGRSCWLFWSYP
ncbi:hypothetical protein LAZ67_10002228 [Cordylochernes scorpioides]|uniref:Uncharacterized protein n=1 Tax=Cordylochernes scorpioides TaxID=51811 RepID=A0ABY6KWJ7_9ARAC|nr:hypothetical protein LAZ67_10002228 [Cordylochernes scorpioides]